MTELEKQMLCGAIYDEQEEKIFNKAQPVKSYSALSRESGKGKKRHLWQFSRKVLGRDFEELQTAPDCVSKAIQRVAIVLWSVRIALNGMVEQFPGVPASEASYALGRVEIGKGKLGNKGGCVVSWGVQGAMQYGLLFRKKYGKYDLTTYSGALANEWGKPKHGLPDELEPFTKAFPILAAAPIRSWDEAITALYNGEPLICGSDWIFEARDSDGYLVKTMNGGHSTIWTGYDDSISDPYIDYDNASWPRIPGMRIEDCPACTGPVRRKKFEAMLEQGECIAVSDITGMPAQSDDLNRLVMI